MWSMVGTPLSNIDMTPSQCVQHELLEGAHGLHRAIDAAAGELALPHQVQQPVADSFN